jgi:hypothetical protein
MEKCAQLHPMDGKMCLVASNGWQNVFSCIQWMAKCVFLRPSSLALEQGKDKSKLASPDNTNHKIKFQVQ